MFLLNQFSQPFPLIYHIIPYFDMTAFLIYICALERIWSITNIIYHGFLVSNIFISAPMTFSYIYSHRIPVLVYIEMSASLVCLQPLGNIVHLPFILLFRQVSISRREYIQYDRKHIATHYRFLVFNITLHVYVCDSYRIILSTVRFTTYLYTILRRIYIKYGQFYESHACI